MTKLFYKRPQINTFFVAIERGFAYSLDNSLENPVEKPEQDW